MILKENVSLPIKSGVVMVELVDDILVWKDPFCKLI